MYGMLNRAPANLPPLLNIQAFQSASSLDTNKRLCKSWPNARNDVLLEPTSVLDIRSPSPSSTLSSSFTGSCEGGVGSIESGAVAVSGLFSEAASDGRPPDRKSFLETQDGSGWKISDKNVEDDNVFSASVSSLEGGAGIGDEHIYSWEDAAHGPGGSLVGFQQNAEGSCSGMTGIIPDLFTRDGGLLSGGGGRFSIVVQEKQGQCSWRNADGGGGGLRRTENSLKSEHPEGFSAPAANTIGGGARLCSGRGDQNMHGLSSEANKLREAKREVQVVEGRLGEAAYVFSIYNHPSADGGGAPTLNATTAGGVSKLEGTIGGVSDEWLLADLHLLQGNGLGAKEEGDGERAGGCLAIEELEELESMLLESPCPAPDSSVIKWILEEGEEASSIQGSTTTTLLQSRAAAAGSDHLLRGAATATTGSVDHLLRAATTTAGGNDQLLRAAAAPASQLLPRAAASGSELLLRAATATGSELLPRAAVPSASELLPRAAAASELLLRASAAESQLLPRAAAAPRSELLPRVAAASELYPLRAASGSELLLHEAMEIQLYNHCNFPSFSPSLPHLDSPLAFPKQPFGALPPALHPCIRPHSATIPRDLEPLQFDQPKPLTYLPSSGSIMLDHPPFDSQVLPFMTDNPIKPQHPPLFPPSNPLLSNVYGNSPTFMANNKLPGAPFGSQPPSSSSENLHRNHCFPLPSVPFNYPQQEFSQQKMLHHPLDGDLEKPVQWQQQLSEPAWHAMQKSTGDPLPHPKQEFPVKLQQNQDRLFSLERRHMQLPELQWVQRGMVSSDEAQLTVVNQLLKAAEAIELGNTGMAQAILARLNQHLSPKGCKPLQRAAFYFREALARRVAGLGPPCQTPSPIEIINKISAYKNYCEISPIPQFAHFTANQAILEAMEGEVCIHLIDFELGFGGQWASFLQEIALRPGGPPKVRITTVGSESIEMQLARGNLNQFARSLNISLESQVISLAQLECLTTSVFQLREGEAVAVNFAFVLNRFLSDFSSTDSFIALLHLVKELSPKVVTVVDHVFECDGPSVFHYFQNHLHYYAALFDSLESSSLAMETLLTIEKDLFAPKIAALVEGAGKEKEKNPHWRNLLRGAGFSTVAFSTTAETQAEYLTHTPTSKGFNTVKDHGTLLLRWQGRSLVCASSWV